MRVCKVLLNCADFSLDGFIKTTDDKDMSKINKSRIRHLRLDSGRDKDILDMADKLSRLEQRKRSDSIRLVLREVLPMRIAQAESQIQT